jgi:Na+-driven multidrug efflux pump
MLMCRFAVSVAISTRVGNLLGATLDDAARTASNVGMLASSSIGIANGYPPPLFSFQRD